MVDFLFLLLLLRLHGRIQTISVSSVCSDQFLAPYGLQMQPQKLSKHDLDKFCAWLADLAALIAAGILKSHADEVKRKFWSWACIGDLMLQQKHVEEKQPRLQRRWKPLTLHSFTSTMVPVIGHLSPWRICTAWAHMHPWLCCWRQGEKVGRKIISLTFANVKVDRHV